VKTKHTTNKNAVWVTRLKSKQKKGIVGEKEVKKRNTKRFKCWKENRSWWATVKR